MKSAKAQPFTDTEILNFALNLEYLEAEFYTVVTTGMTIEQIGIPVTGTGTPGPTTGGSQVSLQNNLVFTQQIALELASDEQAHVLFLRGALGSAAIAKPAINLNALGTGFGSQDEFLALARAFEDVGVSAYAGAAPSLANNATYLQAAAQILGTEAEHSGNIRLQVARLRIATTALDSVDVLPPPSGTQFYSTGTNALWQQELPDKCSISFTGLWRTSAQGVFSRMASTGESTLRLQPLSDADVVANLTVCAGHLVDR